MKSGRPKEDTNKQLMFIYIDKDMLKKVKDFAKEDERSASSWIRKAIKEKLEK